MEEIIMNTVSADDEVMEGTVREEDAKAPAQNMAEEISENAEWDDTSEEFKNDEDQQDAAIWEKRAEPLAFEAEDAAADTRTAAANQEESKKDEESPEDIDCTDIRAYAGFEENEKDDKASLRHEAVMIRADIRDLVIFGHDTEEAFDDSSTYSYLWENRFEASLYGHLIHSPGNRIVPVHHILHLSSREYGLQDKNRSDKEILSGMIKAYLCQGNRLHQEDSEVSIKINACTEGNRIFTNLILEDANRESTDITMGDILKLPAEDKEDTGCMIFQKRNLSDAVCRLVGDKTVRVL
jgi:hypothetical protein